MGKTFKHDEIERKFLVLERPPLVGVNKKHILQYYITANGDEETRLRLENGVRCYMVRKSGSGMVRKEEQVEIPAFWFSALKVLSVSATIRKTRWLIPYRGVIIELDIYGGELKGLVVAEVEFASRRAAMRFVPPAWFGQEVTGCQEYTNRNLATRGFDSRMSGS